MCVEIERLTAPYMKTCTGQTRRTSASYGRAGLEMMMRKSMKFTIQKEILHHTLQEQVRE